MYRCKIQTTLYVSFYNTSFNNNMKKISNISVSSTGYILQVIIIHICRKSRYHFMLEHPDFNNTDKQNRLPTFVLEDFV